MIQTFSTTIRRKEMDAVLTCMVDERIGPGDINTRFILAVKDFLHCDGAVALRSPSDALKYALRSLDFASGQKIMISALAPVWHIKAVEECGCEPLVLDVDEKTGLLTPELVQEGINEGGRLLLLHESMGIIPDVQGICALGIPVIEDVSKSAGAVVPIFDENGNKTEEKNAGSFGIYTIMALEEHDVITAGGGAILAAPKRREWIVLKKFVDEMVRTELLPDINCALGLVQVKEFKHNELLRKKMYAVFQRACLSGRHTMFVRNSVAASQDSEAVPQEVLSETTQETSQSEDNTSTMCCFPLVLSTSFKDVERYTNKKDIQIAPAYADSVIAFRQDELSAKCIKAKSLYLRCALFPLYPRLSQSQVAKIAKVLGTLP